MTELACTDAFRTVGPGDAIPNDFVVPYYLDDRKLRISIARVDDRLYAFDDLCTCADAGCPLSGGLLTGTTIMCQCHGSRFDIRTGIRDRWSGDRGTQRLRGTRGRRRASNPSVNVMANASPTPKAVTLVLVPALVLMLAFAFFYVGAFHDPTPHHVRVAVVGPPAVAAELNRLPGDPLDAREASSHADALSQIDDREVYGAYEAATNRLFVASAANRATAIALGETFNRVAAATRPAVRVTDVKPLPLRTPTAPRRFTR